MTGLQVQPGPGFISPAAQGGRGFFWFGKNGGWQATVSALVYTFIIPLGSNRSATRLNERNRRSLARPRGLGMTSLRWVKRGVGRYLGEVVDVVFGRVLETTVRFPDPASLVCAGCFPHS